MSMVAKAYEKVKNAQNEKAHNSMSQMQATGRKQRSTIDSLIIIISITEQKRLEKTYMYILSYCNLKTV